MSRLQRKLEAGQFVITAEVCPPKGCDCTEFLRKAAELGEVVDAINVTDNQGANMRVAPLAAASLLVREGLEPLFQVTCRDRNRLALQSDLLGAAALGITNILALSGDHISFGDHPFSKPVFDMDSVQLLQAVDVLNNGHDLSGAPLAGVPRFFAGAAASPEAEPFAVTEPKLRKKALSGARFFQTQAVFLPEKAQQFTNAIQPLGVKVIYGILVLKSAAMARFINRNIPGLKIPDEIVTELAGASDPAEKGVEIATRIARAVRPLCNGLHFMAMGREESIPRIVKEVL